MQFSKSILRGRKSILGLFFVSWWFFGIWVHDKSLVKILNGLCIISYLMQQLRLTSSSREGRIPVRYKGWVGWMWNYILVYNNIRNFQSSLQLSYRIRLQWNLSLQSEWDSTLKGLQVGFYSVMSYQNKYVKGN